MNFDIVVTTLLLVDIGLRAFDLFKPSPQPSVMHFHQPPEPKPAPIEPGPTPLKSPITVFNSATKS